MGISVDSVSPRTMTHIGRVTRLGQTLDLIRLTHVIKLYRSLNPHGKVKINTVVNKWNYQETISCFISAISPDKWKVLRVLPNLNPTESITDAEFQAFIGNNGELSDIWIVEDNEDMIGSYIMIDPKGRFFDNSQTLTGYTYSDPIPNVGVEKAYSQVGFNEEKFRARYANTAYAS